MRRRVFSREFKLEAVKLIKERRVAVAQASHDLDVGESVLRRWLREGGADPPWMVVCPPDRCISVYPFGPCGPCIATDRGGARVRS
jgi:hypothetical protein